MNEFLQQAPAIIEAAAKSTLGILALIVLGIGTLAYVFFRRESHRIRLVIFFACFLGAAIFAGAVVRAPETGAGDEAVQPLLADSSKLSVDRMKATSSCLSSVSAFRFEQNQPYLVGLTSIRLGMSLQNGVRHIANCGLVHRIEMDAPAIRRLEVTLNGGLIAGVTYYAMNGTINSIAMSLSEPNSHIRLREVARTAFGEPTEQYQSNGYTYDKWDDVGGVTLTLFERGGSIFYE